MASDVIIDDFGEGTSTAKTVTAPYSRKIAPKYTRANLKKMPDTDGNTYQMTWSNKDFKFKYKPKGSKKYQYKGMGGAIESYEVSWNYKVGGVWFAGATNTVESNSSTPKSDTYDPPENATAVRCKVKCTSKTFKNSKDKDTKFFTGTFGKWVKRGHNNATNDPETPEAPSYYVDYSTNQLLVYMTIKDPNTTHVKFRLAEDRVFDDTDEDGLYKVQTVKLMDGVVGYAFYDKWVLRPGHVYRLSARAQRQSGGTSEWSEEWSEWTEVFETGPETIADFSTVPTMETPTSIKMAWKEVGTDVTEWKEIHSAVTYDLEYLAADTKLLNYAETAVTNLDFATRSPAIQTIEIAQSDLYLPEDDQVDTHGIRNFLLQGLDTGVKYFFRLRPKNQYGSAAAYSKIRMCILGTKPNIPTVWSKNSIVTDGSDLIIYWMHNSVDGSLEQQSKIEYQIGDNDIVSVTTNNPTDKYGVFKSETRSYTIPNPGFDNTIVKWRVCTRGVLYEYSDWSDWQEIKLYIKPTISLYVRNQFPLIVQATLTPTSQSVVDSSLQIFAVSDHYAIDGHGDLKQISAGELVYSKTKLNDTQIVVYAKDLPLGSKQKYKIRSVVNTSAGLSAEATSEFTSPVRNISSNPKLLYSLTLLPESLSAEISIGEADALRTIALRKDVDGRYAQLVRSDTKFIDSHAPLQNANYKIVKFSDDGTTVETKEFDTVSFGEISDWSKATWSSNQLKRPKDIILGAVLQWDDQWLSLLYDLDIAPSYKTSSTEVEYDGREDPVIYKNSMKSLTDSWSLSVDKHDRETIDKVRALALYNGPVHIREPRGSSYWASVEVGISETHNEPLVTVSFNITRTAIE